MENENLNQNSKKAVTQKITFTVISFVISVTFLAGFLRLITTSNNGFLVTLAGLNFYGLWIFSFVYLVSKKYEENNKIRRIFKVLLIISLVLNIAAFVAGYFEFINTTW